MDITKDHITNDKFKDTLARTLQPTESYKSAEKKFLKKFIMILRFFSRFFLNLFCFRTALLFSLVNYLIFYYYVLVI